MFDPTLDQMLEHNKPQIAELSKYLRLHLKMLTAASLNSSNTKHTLMCINSGRHLGTTAMKLVRM